MATKKTTAKPSTTVTKDQITELMKLNTRQAQADAAALAAEQALNPDYTPVDIATGSDEAVAAAEAAAAQAEKIQADIAAEGAKAYVQKNAPLGTTVAQMNKILPEGEKIVSGNINAPGNLPQFTATDGTKFYDEKSYRDYQDYISGNRANRQSAYDLLFEQFSSYGLGSLVEPIRNLITDPSVSPSEYVIRLRQTEAYKKRFAANASRIANGLAALSEADYLNYEDRYQRVMRNYGIPASYYEKGDLGVQKNFEKLIAGDVRDDELADRLSNAYDKVINANPEVGTALKSFYPEITNGDILAYVLDPQNALTEIKRKVTAAEIGGAALSAGLLGKTSQEIAKNLPGFGERAKELAGFGITGQQYGAQSPFITSAAERGGELSSIYKQDAYGRTQAEAEAFNITGSTEARKQRQKLSELEKSSFSGSAGTSNAIARDRAGAF